MKLVLLSIVSAIVMATDVSSDVSNKEQVAVTDVKETNHLREGSTPAKKQEWGLWGFGGCGGCGLWGFGGCGCGRWGWGW